MFGRVSGVFYPRLLENQGVVPVASQLHWVVGFWSSGFGVMGLGLGLPR